MHTGILRRLTNRHIASSISMFADDVVIFCHPTVSELATIRALLGTFGDASDLHTNFLKCSATPICCDTGIDDVIADTLSCAVTAFPITYLGLPLSIRKPSSSAMLPLVDKLTRALATWRASLLSRGEWLALVRHVLTVMPVHILLAMSINPTILKKVTQVIRDFLWHGRKDAKAGCCPVSWLRVCRPIEFGGLGVRDLHRTGISLRTRWLWLQATDTSRPWHGLQLPCDDETREFFRASTIWSIGDGRTCRFWCDHWLGGQSISEIAPTLLALVPRHRRRRTLVCDGLA